MHIEDYPAIKAHLDQYWDRISKRADKGDTPYNLRNCAYLEDFFKPKVVYMEIQTDNPNQGYPFPCFSKASSFLSIVSLLVMYKFYLLLLYQIPPLISSHTFSFSLSCSIVKIDFPPKNCYTERSVFDTKFVF